MTDGAGVLRSAASLEAAAKSLGELGGSLMATEARGTEQWEATNCAPGGQRAGGRGRLRRETRGCHWREDFPDADEVSADIS